MGADLEGQPTKGREASALEATQGCISLSVSHVDSFILTISVLEYRQFCYFQPALCSRHHAPVVYILSFACILRARHFRAVSNRVRFQPEASESIHSDTSTLITKEVLMPTARPQTHYSRNSRYLPELTASTSHKNYVSNCEYACSHSITTFALAVDSCGCAGNVTRPSLCDGRLFRYERIVQLCSRKAKWTCPISFWFV
jgi:hypothetical protein